jgi:hypothetical protein
MEGNMRASTRSVWVGASLVLLGFAAGALVRGDAGKSITRWTVADLKWTPTPGTPLSGVVAWTAPSGAFCNFTKFPKGTKIGSHHHSADVSAVVVAGEFGSYEQGSKPALAGPGGYQLIPGGLVHTTECGAAADCVVFVCGPAAFDLIEDKPATK